MGIVLETSPEQVCNLPCPLPVLSGDNFRANYVLSVVCGWLSFVMSGLMVLTWLAFRKNRKWPRRIVFWMSFSGLLEALPFVGNSFLEMESYLCATHEQPALENWCLAQGYIMVMSGLFMTCWLLVYAFHVFYTASRPPSDSRWLEKWYHLVGWGPGLFV